MTSFQLTSKEFYAALDQDRLIGSRCLDCGHISAPQRQICPACHSDRQEVIEFEGKGTLAAFTVVSVPPTHMAAAGYGAKNPYCVGIVTLQEGARVCAQILDVDVYAPHTIRIGTPLVMTTIERGEGETRKKYLAFEPA
jgi:uncharacterized OB-fold protein